MFNYIRSVIFNLISYLFDLILLINDKVKLKTFSYE